MSESGPYRVLVVDDEADIADAYALRLELDDDYEVETAYGGREAIEAVDDTFDVLLLDRRMPEVSGDEVLEHVREADIDCRAIMVTAVDPDFDIVEMPFDDYLCKPIDKEDLFEAIEQQLSFRSYDDALSEYMSISSKIAVLEAEKLPEELEENDEYQRLTSRADALQEQLDETVAEFDDMELAFREVGRAGDL